MEETQICTIIINENIRNVMSNEPLTLPLKKLNTDCRFKKFYEDYCDVIFGSRAKEYYEKNKDKIKEYREKNKDKIKEYYKKNKDKIKEYYGKNKDKINKKRRERYYKLKKKKKNDNSLL